MSSTRQKLRLDEQAFQDLLAAAFTIQEHNAQRKLAGATKKHCGYCGAPMPPGEELCAHCGADPQGFRAGERLQRNWASMWLASQDQQWRPYPAAPVEEAAQPASGASGPETHEFPLRISEVAEDPRQLPELIEDRAEEEAGAEQEETAPDVDSEIVQVEHPAEVVLQDESSLAPSDISQWRDLAFWRRRLKLRFDRSDLYLILAIGVAAVALFWVATAARPSKPGAASHRRVHLTVWERTLVNLGLAEAPDPPVYRGNPSAQVWVDPHTALYYCQGEDQYGKAPGGHVTTQREAQMDQFEPSERAACE